MYVLEMGQVGVGIHLGVPTFFSLPPYIQVDWTDLQRCKVVSLLEPAVYDCGVLQLTIPAGLRPGVYDLKVSGHMQADYLDEATVIAYTRISIVSACAPS